MTTIKFPSRQLLEKEWRAAAELLGDEALFAMAEKAFAELDELQIEIDAAISRFNSTSAGANFAASTVQQRMR